MHEYERKIAEGLDAVNPESLDETPAAYRRRGITFIALGVLPLFVYFGLIVLPVFLALLERFRQGFAFEFLPFALILVGMSLLFSGFSQISRMINARAYQQLHYAVLVEKRIATDKETSSADADE